MSLLVHSTELDNLLLVEHPISHDATSTEEVIFDAPTYATFGMKTRFVADRFMRVYPETLQGLYYQKTGQMAQLFTIIDGAASVVCVDIRRGSQSFGQWVRVDMTSEKRCQLYIGEGLAFGLCTGSQSAAFHIKQTELLCSDHFGGIMWNDSDLGIEWPIEAPYVSPRDNNFLMLRDIADAFLPVKQSSIGQ